MHRTLLVLIATLIFSAFGVAADAPLLPDQFADWQAQGPVESLRVTDIDTYVNRSQTPKLIFQEAGVTQMERRIYRRGADLVTVRLFAFRDPSSAYEAYTYLLAPGMQDLGLGKDSAGTTMGQNLVARVLVGNFIVEGTLPPSTPPAVLGDLISNLKPKADTTAFPPLKAYLPEHWKIFGSEKYALGPEGFRAAMASLGQDAYAGLAKEAGFENGAEAIFANYRGQHGSGTLLLLEYPTPQLAEQHLHHLEQALPADLKKAGVTVERKASLLSLVFSPTSPEHAQAIRDEVNYDTEVTWNEPSHTATDPPMVLVMFKIFIFTGLFLGIATAVGVAFGGLRVIIKRVFPGKVFDRPENIEVLQLGLSGKKIDPTDMY